MKPTADVPPRRDGWFEHDGTWGEVTVGTVIATPASRTQRWEIMEVANGTAPIPPMKTLWMRAVEQTSGAEFRIEPRTKTAKVVILTRDPADTTTAPVTPASDTEAVWALVEGLGATLMASRDDATGEITCPDYTYDSHLEGDGQAQPIRRGLIDHMRVAHGMVADDDTSLVDAITTHARAHDAMSGLTKGGFAHRHVPEDINLIIGRKGR